MNISKLISKRELAVLLAEFVGTFILALVVASLNLQYEFVEAQKQPVNQLATFWGPAIIGATLAFLIYLLGKYGATHFNPVVSLASFIRGNIGVKRFVGSWVAQLLGAVGGVLLVLAIFNEPKFSIQTYEDINANLAFVNLDLTVIAQLETIGAFLLVLAVLVIAKRKTQSNLDPIIIGTGLTIGILISQSFTGGILNPAIAIAMKLPAVYWFAPMLGGVIAALLTLALDTLADSKPETVK